MKLLTSKILPKIVCLATCIFFFALVSKINMTNFKIGTLNLNCARDSHKIMILFEFIRQKQIDIVFLQVSRLWSVLVLTEDQTYTVSGAHSPRFVFSFFKVFCFPVCFPRHGCHRSSSCPSLWKFGVGVWRDCHECCESAGRSSVKSAGRSSVKPPGCGKPGRS